MAERSKKVAKPKRPRGGQTIRTPAIEDEVIAWIESGQTLRAFCRQPGKPSRRAIDDWRSLDTAFAARFARAREIGFDVIAEEALAIADTPQAGKVVTVDKDGKKTVTEDMLGHRKLQFEARLKLLSKWDPKRYGDRLELDHTGTIELAEKVRRARERATKR